MTEITSLETKLSVSTGMDTIINTLNDVYSGSNSSGSGSGNGSGSGSGSGSSKGDKRLVAVIRRLQSGENLWDVNTSDMDLMPQWIREQNASYMNKKANIDHKKHWHATHKLRVSGY